MVCENKQGNKLIVKKCGLQKEVIRNTLFAEKIAENDAVVLAQNVAMTMQKGSRNGSVTFPCLFSEGGCLGRPTACLIKNGVLELQAGQDVAFL